MLKPLWAAIAVIMLAAPAPAGLTPESLNPAELHPAVSRSATYAPNDPGHVYDMMTTEVGGPENLWYQVTQNVASGAFCNLIHLKPGATSISSIHIVIDQRLATAPWTFSIAFRNDVGGATPIGSFLTTQAFNSPAWYIVGGMPFGGASPTLFQFSLGAIAANASQTNIWTCVQGSANFRVRTGNVSGNETHGNPGDGTPTSHYIGSGFGDYASSYGVGIGSASLMSSFTFGFPGDPRPGNWHMALGGVPEPATIGLIGLAVLVLRRRKA